MPFNSTASGLLNTGWGRAAVGRFSKAPDEIRSEVIRALESKISVEFKDYSQWEREPVTQPQVTSSKRQRSGPLRKQTSPRPHSGVSGTSCSSLCIHPWTKNPQPVYSPEEGDDERNISLLSTLIDMKKKSIERYESLCKDLELQNHDLKIEIKHTSLSNHCNVTNLLEKYKEFADSSKAIKRNHVKEYYCGKVNLKITSLQLQTELEHLEQGLLDLEMQLRTFHRDLQVLRTYKDKEYPVKEMQISELIKNLNDLALHQKIEKSELDKVTNGESFKLHMNHNMRQHHILEDAAHKAFACRVSIGDIHMARHNALLRQEIKEHKQNVKEVEEAVRLLKTEVKNLRQMNESNIRMTLFSGVFFSSRTCHPDEDVLLDIPSQQPVPF